ncbi:hypothetical protein ScPMuIL_006059 [Solemya velum]
MFSRSLDKATKEEFHRRFMSTQRILFSLDKSIDPDIFSFVSNYAECIGSAKELIFFPLITAIASCMGEDATVQVNPEWKEKIVLWYIISSRRGEKKSLALNRIKEAAKGLEKETQAVLKVRNTEPEDRQEVSCFVLDENRLSSFDGLTFQKQSNLPLNALVMLDNFGSVLSNPHKYNLPDPDILLQLYTGPKERDEFDNDNQKVLGSRVNFVAMSQSLDIVSLFATPDPDCFLDRVLIACPKEESRLGFSPSFSPPQSTPSLQTLLSTVRSFHQVQKMTYSFSTEGLAEFLRCTEKFQQMRDLVQGDERRGTINKAPGQMARLGAALTALANGLTMATDSMPSKCLPAAVIDASIVKSAFLLTKYSIDLKLALLPQYEANSQEIAYEMTSANENETMVSDMYQQQFRNYRKRPFTEGQGHNVKPEKRQHSQHLGEKRLNGQQAHEKRLHGQQNIYNYSSFPQSMHGFDNQTTEMTSDDSHQAYIHPSGLGNQTQQVFAPQLHFTSPALQADQSSSHSGTEINHTVVYTDSDSACQEQVIPNVKKEILDSPPPPENIYLDKTAPNNLGSSVRTYVRSVNKDKNAADIYEFSDEDFIQHCCDKMRKMMLTKCAVITAAFACQYKLFPPVPVCLRMASPNTRHPAWAASKFFERMQHFGLGTVSKTRGSSLRFMKHRLEDMATEAKEMLFRIGISDVEYDQSYPKHMGLPLPVMERSHQAYTDTNFLTAANDAGMYKVTINDFETSE